MTTRWTKEQAWKWYNSRPWFMGFNYVPGPVRNSIELWQESTFAKSMEKVEKELALAEEIGFNCLRLFMPEFVWKHQRDSFMRNFDTFLAGCDKHGIGVMCVLYNDCKVPERIAKSLPAPKFGPQPDPDWGYHGGTKATPFDGTTEVGWWEGDNPDTWPEKERFVKDVVGTHAKDPRVICWDIWNEPGNSNRECISLPLMEKCFAWAREMDPIQPLTAGAWNFSGDIGDRSGFFGNPLELSAVEKRAIELSDIITFHYYGSFPNMKYIAGQLKLFERPIMNTEWLHRPLKNFIQDCIPYFARERIGSFHWGLVNGFRQFHEPWEFLRAKAKEMGLDLSLWQHDIIRADHTPYNAEEIDIFKTYAPNTRNKTV